jgi:hypothetical protein
VSKHYDKIELQRNSLEDAIVSHRYSCTAAETVGDIVFFGSIDDTVERNTDNREQAPSVGIIIEKDGDTECIVQTYGPCLQTFTGLAKNKKVFLGTDGKPTTAKPGNGYIQAIGYTYAEEKLFINPSVDRIKQNPF